jgi:hypothetical protein
MDSVKFEHKTGTEAYLWLYLHRNMRVKIDSIILFVEKTIKEVLRHIWGRISMPGNCSKITYPPLNSDLSSSELLYAWF